MWTAIRHRTFQSLRRRRSDSFEHWNLGGRNQLRRGGGGGGGRYPTSSTGGIGGNASNRITRMKRTSSEKQRTLEKQFGTQTFKFKFGNSFFRQIYWSLRRFQFWLCFYDDDVEIDVEDLLANPFNTQPPSLDELQRLTGFRRDWLMFIYRNFKQIASNGRMSQSQWRQVFRLIFRGATDYEFADRFFMAIAGTRSQKLITFEDLIFCLYDICSSFNRKTGSMEGNGQQSQHSPISTSAEQFTFNLMMPDDQGRVDEAGFVKYTKSVFNLNASLSDCSGDAFGMFHNMSNNTNSQSVMADKSTSSSSNKSGEKVSPPWIGCFARKQFRTLDVDGDGYITLEDIQRLFAQKVFYESLYLRPESDMLFKSFHQLSIQSNE